MTEGIIEPPLATRRTAVMLPRVAAGERDAMQECIDTYGGLVWSLAHSLSATQAEAEDAVQEIFMDLWKTADRYDTTRASETTWVAMIARRRLIDRRRRAQRIPLTTEISDELTETLPDPVPEYDHVIEMSAEAAQATKAMLQLKATQQLVLRLAVYQGMTYQEIAQATGIPLGMVKTYIRRGLLHIRHALGIRTVDAGSFLAEEVQA